MTRNWLGKFDKFEMYCILKLPSFNSMDVQGNFTPVDSEGFIKTQAIRLNTFRYVYDKCPYSGTNWGEKIE